MIPSLFSCAEMPSSSVMPLPDIPANAMSFVSSYLEEDPCPLDRRFNEAATTELSVKSVFKERFDIPELVTDDVDENEKELKFILETFSKFTANPDHVYQALRSEFLHGNNFNVLLPNLMRYFDRYQPNRDKMYDIDVLIKNHKFDYILREAPKSLSQMENMVFQDDKLIRGFQEFIVANPQHLHLIRDRFNRPATSMSKYKNISQWFKVALISNMPKLIFEVLSQYTVNVFEGPCIFTGIFIPKEHHPEIFEKINFLIDNSIYEEIRERYRLYNRVRYGPEDPNLFTEIFRSSYSLTEQQEFELCYCASMANKMDLFYRLLLHVMPYIMKHPDMLKKLSNYSNYVFKEESIEMYKFIFDIHANSVDSLRQEIYQRTEFLNIVAKYYRIDYINLNGYDLMLVLKISVGAATSEFPGIFAINYRSVPAWKLANFPERFIFNRAELLESFLVDLFKVTLKDQVALNAENLNYVMKSESIRQMLNYNIENSLIPRQPFIVSMDSYMKVNDDEFDFPVTDIAMLNIRGPILFRKSKAAYQFRKYEVLLKQPLSTFIRPKDDYFEFRNVFKYLIENGKELPEDLSERTRELLRIDFPGINLP